MSEEKATHAPVDPARMAMRGRCPHCGRGKLFAGFLSLQPRCSNCGLDYAFIDSGDGPAVFVILIVGFVVVGLALYTEVTFDPPLWLHFLLWLPLTIVLSLPLLRLLKGLMIGLQYRNKASEGRLGGDGGGADV